MISVCGIAIDGDTRGYLSMLQSHLGKSTFTDILKRLEQDQSIGREDMITIADEFYGPLAKGASRQKAIDIIRSRHRKLVDFR